MGNNTEVRHQSRFRTLYYWFLLLVILVIADDATFGWMFWALAMVSPWLSALVALVLYWAMGYWITVRGLMPYPGKVAGWFLSRLQLERKNPELRSREETLRNRITSIAWAIPMSLFFGGVVTTLWLRRRGIVSQKGAYRLGFVLCGIYAAEFALLHGLGLGGSLFWAIR